MAAPRDLFNQLPQETRLQIFRLGTIKPSQAEDTRPEYRPFDPVALRDRDWSNSNQRALSVKAAIVLVCKEWKSIATEMLYECIRIRHGTHNLLAALESTRYSSPDVASDSGVEVVEYDYGRWVRRVEISPEIMDFDPFNPYPLLRILQCCPFVQTIVRASLVLGSGGISLGFVRLPPGTSFPSFPSIKRIDWWLSGIASFSSRTAHDGVYGFLGELVAHSPGLNYLTLSGGGDGLLSPRAGVDPFGKNSGPFNSLTTLRLEGEDVELIVTEPSPHLPNLSRLIVGRVYAGIQKMLNTYGHQIRVLEFLDIRSFPAPAFILSPNELLPVLSVLKACPNLEELNANLITGDLLAGTGSIDLPIPLNSLRTIRIHMDDSPPRAALAFSVFIRQFILCPELERIVLHGGTRQACEAHHIFSRLKKFVSERRFVSLEFQES
ncbi:hypothetical protein M413DRAFT_438737 [Hebeloma cylindrosporum]|uniref:F-box domain-containing protein n=1 Tax=Hebeloma cylindrosporum TaxID=76867 RepID=A0A0C3CLH3_HEBCY|nr:hypothetical protein M413DRAFT_438737 [Hebeloma cylindrosporum h7]